MCRRSATPAVLRYHEPGRTHLQEVPARCQEITIGRKNESGTSNVKHVAFCVHAKDKYAALKRIVDYYPQIYGIIFCRTRKETQEIADKLMQEG